MNYTHIAQNKVVEPGLSDFLLGLLSDFTTIQKPAAPFSNPGDEVRIKTAHVPATDKGFIRCYQVKQRHTGKGDPAGTFGAMSLNNEYDIFMPGFSPEQMEFVKNSMNDEWMTLHRNSDCDNDYWVQLGDACRPARIEWNYTLGTFEPTGEKGFFGKVKWYGIPKFYEATVPYAPAVS
jgi:hypothetical protein